MKTLYFKNTAKSNDIKANLYASDNTITQKILSNVDVSGNYTLEFDNEKYDHIEFIDEKNKMTCSAYTGALSIGIEYKKNEQMGRELTYLFSKDVESSGRVDNYEIRDEINLAYRKDKSKKISVFVPSSYDGNTPHDILYFFDAQNLFCKAGEYTQNGDPYGSWQLDLVISELHRQYGKNIIVVGIDNADEYRSHELFMSPDKFGKLSPLATNIPDDNFSKGYLDNLSEFMVNTLHPFIKDKYCVREDNIGIGGSSMGGIASFYCGLREEGFYKYVLSYSPAFGLYEMSAFENYFLGADFDSKAEILPSVHIYCGGGDQLEQMLLPSSKAMKSTLAAYGYPSERIFETYDDEKPHNEESWRLILCDSFTKLLNLK